jgi:transposase, IS30 family
MGRRIGKPPTSRCVERVFWRHVRQGMDVEAAAAAVGVSERVWRRWLRDGGGMPTLELAEPSGRYLSVQEREEIAVGLAAKESIRSTARRLGRAPSTIKREIDRNCPRAGRYLNRTRYRASGAQALAEERARRPKERKLAVDDELRAHVQAKLDKRCSPEQIAYRLVLEFPDDERMRISHEAIYQSIYVQGRGGLRKEVHKALRTGRALRKPRGQLGERRGRIKDMVMISERPPEVQDRAVPGHWEGDLIVGKESASAIGTLVERTTRFTMLLHLTDHTALSVREAIAAKILTLPAALRRTLTWDQGKELAEHLQLKLATEMDVYFCDPHSPWQRGTNENTNGLLRQYFPKGTDLSKHSTEFLDEVAAELNERPRKTLGWYTPAEALAELLSTA